MFLSWLVFPLVATVACLGLGLLLDFAVGKWLPGVLLLPVGFALLVVVTQFTTLPAQSFPFSVVVVAVLAVLGLVVGLPRLRSARIDWSAGLLAVLLFLLFGLVILITGEPTFVGYGLLGDTSVHFIGADYLVNHGQSFDGLDPSSYSRVLIEYFDINGYPSGLHTAFGTLGTMTGVNLAWVYQPFLALLVVFAGLSAYGLAQVTTKSKTWALLIGALSLGASLIYAFYLQGSLKELGFAALLITGGAVFSVWSQGEEQVSRKVVIPLVVVAAAMVGAIGTAAVAWLVPLTALVVVYCWFERNRQATKPLKFCLAVGAGLAGVLVLVIPTLTKLDSYIGGTKFLSQQNEIGNLTHGPISPFEMFGVWLADDYREPPGINYTITYILIGLALLLMIGAAVQLTKRKKWGTLGFLIASLLAALAVVSRGSPWADVKAYMITAPLVMLLAGLGCFYLAKATRRWIGLACLIVLLCGAAASDLFQGRAAFIAPYEKLNELAKINDRYAGTKPVYVNGFDEFAKYFLRDLSPDMTNDHSIRQLVTLDGSVPQFGQDFPVEKIAPVYLQNFKLLVLPKGAEPPGNDFRLVQSGNYYDVWRLRAG